MGKRNRKQPRKHPRVIYDPGWISGNGGTSKTPLTSRPMIVNDDPSTLYAPRELTEGVTGDSRNANGGRKYPRTNAHYVAGSLKDPVKVTRADGTTELVNGDHFSKTERKRKTEAAATYVDRTNESWRLRNIVGTIGDND